MAIASDRRGSAAGRPSRSRHVRPEEARPRLAALGFRDEDVETLAAHFLDAERRGLHGHGLSRIEWLETWESLPLDARPRRVLAEAGYELWDGEGALGYLVMTGIALARPARRWPHRGRHPLSP